MDTTKLFSQVDELLANGDEAVLREFVVAHIQEFPEEMRDEIAMYFFEEAVNGQAADIQAEEAFLSEAPKALAELDQFKRFLEEKLKLAEVKGRLNGEGA